MFMYEPIVLSVIALRLKQNSRCFAEVTVHFHEILFLDVIDEDFTEDYS